MSKKEREKREKRKRNREKRESERERERNRENGGTISHFNWTLGGLIIIICKK